MKSDFQPGAERKRPRRSSLSIDAVIQRDTVDEAGPIDFPITAEVQGPRVGAGGDGELALLEVDPSESDARAEAEGADGSDPPLGDLDPVHPKDLVDMLLEAEGPSASLDASSATAQVAADVAEHELAPAEASAAEDEDQEDPDERLEREEQDEDAFDRLEYDGSDTGPGRSADDDVA